METLDIVHKETPYEPTTEQIQRAARLRRFNLMFVYLPIGLVTAIVLALVVILLIMAINPPDENTRHFLSGLADATLALALLPIMIINAILVGAAVFALSKTRGDASTAGDGQRPAPRTQRFLWRVDAAVGQVKVHTERTAGMIAGPFLSINGAVAYLRMLITQLVRIVKRS